ncbi:MAG: hypothetical protein JNG90_07015, partial [Planctomycetaceae bacterium]|nr:hypothetical protein [Planctomycetaceae bacterium]
MTKVKRLPPRSQVKQADTWDLGKLFVDDHAWEEAFAKYEKQIPGYARFQGKLAEDPKTLAACLKYYLEVDRQGERLGTYAFLRTAEDTSNSGYQRMQARFHNAASRAAQASSFLQPELMAIPDKKMRELLAAKQLAPYRLMLERWLRYKPHTLTDREEKLLAMQSEMSSAASQIFRQLQDADLKFGLLKNERGETVELSHSSYSAFLHSPSRQVRKKAFHQYYAQYEAHKHTIAASLNGSIQRDIYYARARNY